MKQTKKRRDKEEYEQYWEMTAAWTNIYGVKFNKALKITLRFIDIHLDALLKMDSKSWKEDSQLYDKLQDELIFAFKWSGKDPYANARKGINTFVKLGFINPFLKGYNPLAKKFINTTNDNVKCIVFSKIFYESASFSSSVTKDNRNEKQLSFLLRTLDKNKYLTVNDIKALMITDIHLFPKGYLNREELNMQLREALLIDFDERKYNQIDHLMSFLKTFSDLYYNTKEKRIYFADNPYIVDEEYDGKYQCDPIKLRLHRQELLEESRSIYGKEICYLEKKAYKGLRDSHIKPKQLCLNEGNEEQAYDVNNGLLLSPNVDQYFDKFDISFSDEGNIIIGKAVEAEIFIEYKEMSLDSAIMTEERKKYLAYHRSKFYEKNGVV